MLLGSHWEVAEDIREVDTVQDKEPAEVGTIAAVGTEVGKNLGQEGNQVGDSQMEGILEKEDILQEGNQQEGSQAANIKVEGNPEVPRQRLLAREQSLGQLLESFLREHSYCRVHTLTRTRLDQLTYPCYQ